MLEAFKPYEEPDDPYSVDRLLPTRAAAFHAVTSRTRSRAASQAAAASSGRALVRRGCVYSRATRAYINAACASAPRPVA